MIYCARTDASGQYDGTSSSQRRRPLRVWGIRLVLAVCLVGWISLGSPAFGQGQESDRVVQVGFELHELRLVPNQPGKVSARFRLNLQWNPEILPGFRPETVGISNAVGDLTLLEVDPVTPDAPPNRQASYVVTGQFKSYNDYRDFPFDWHELAFILTAPAGSNFRFVALDGDLGILRSKAPKFQLWRFDGMGTNLTRFDGWTFDKIAFFNNPAAFLQSVPKGTMTGETPFAGIVIWVGRNSAMMLAQFIVPLLVIWLVGYLGFFWDDTSPASRCGSAALFAAVAFSIGVRALHPDVSYITGYHVMILAMYGTLGVSTLAVTLFFWTLKRQGERLARRIWWIGIVASPLLLIIAALWCLHLSRSAPVDYLFKPDTHALLLDLDEEP